MNFFAETPTLEERIMALPAMHKMLECLQARHMALERSATVDSIWSRVHGKNDFHNRDDHISAALNAGLIKAIPGGGQIAMRISLTDKGREIIGAQKPFWET